MTVYSPWPSTIEQLMAYVLSRIDSCVASAIQKHVSEPLRQTTNEVIDKLSGLESRIERLESRGRWSDRLKRAREDCMVSGTVKKPRMKLSKRELVFMSVLNLLASFFAYMCTFHDRSSFLRASINPILWIWESDAQNQGRLHPFFVTKSDLSKLESSRIEGRLFFGVTMTLLHLVTLTRTHLELNGKRMKTFLMMANHLSCHINDQHYTVEEFCTLTNTKPQGIRTIEPFFRKFVKHKEPCFKKHLHQYLIPVSSEIFECARDNLHEAQDWTNTYKRNDYFIRRFCHYVPSAKMNLGFHNDGSDGHERYEDNQRPYEPPRRSYSELMATRPSRIDNYRSSASVSMVGSSQASGTI